MVITFNYQQLEKAMKEANLNILLLRSELQKRYDIYISERTFFNWKTGKTEPKNNFLLPIAKILKKRIEYFYV